MARRNGPALCGGLVHRRPGGLRHHLPRSPGDRPRAGQGTRYDRPERAPGHRRPARPGVRRRAPRLSARTARVARLFSAWMRAADRADVAQAFTAAREAWTAPAWLAVAPQRARFELAPELDEALTIVSTLGHSFWRWFRLKWWRARSAVQEAVTRHWTEATTRTVDPSSPPMCATGMQPATPGTPSTGCTACSTWRHLRLSDAEAARSWLAVLDRTRRAARDLAEHRPALASVDAWPASWSRAESGGWDTRVDALRELLTIAKAHAATMQPVQRVFPWLAADLDVPAPGAARGLAAGRGPGLGSRPRAGCRREPPPRSPRPRPRAGRRGGRRRDGVA